MKKTLMKKFFALVAVVMLLLCNMVTVNAADFDFDTAAESVVFIVTDVGYAYGTGSGFAITENYIMTNAHVIEDGKDIAIACYDKNKPNGIGEIYSVEVICANYNMDIAILRIKGAKLTPLPIGDSSKVKAGEEVFAIGAPEGMTFTLTKGIVSATNRVIEGNQYIQVDAAINHGNSGGPLFNKNGEVIGVNTAKIDGADNLGFVVPIDIAVEYAKKQISGLKLQYAEADEATPTPEATKAPEKTEEPEETKAPAKTEKPEVTEAPEKTEKPQKTDAPAKTEKPEKTEKPKKTAKPEQSEENATGLLNGLLVLGTGTIVAIVGGILVLVAIAVVIILVLVKSGSKEDEEDPYMVAQNKEEAKQEQYQPEQKIPETTPFTPVAEVKKASGKIIVLNGVLGGTEYEIIDGQTLNIGKDAQFANIVIDKSYQAVSRRHLTVLFKNNLFYVTDISSNGTYHVNGQRLAPNTAVAVERGSVISLANESCQIRLK